MMIYAMCIDDAHNSVRQGIVGRTRLAIMAKMNDMSHIHQTGREKAMIAPYFDSMERKACMVLKDAFLAKRWSAETVKTPEQVFSIHAFA
jgi:hypothetical protein